MSGSNLSGAADGARPSDGRDGTAFIGRARELAHLRQLLSATRALTLCGAGGIGKTRLALRLTAETAADLVDRAWFVDLSDLRQPDLIAPRVAFVTGVVEDPDRPLLSTLVEAIRPRPTLVVLDNCEHLIDACARFCQRMLASCPDLRLIVTSREPLRIAAETVWQVPPLAVPPAGDLSPADMMRWDAVRLFADRAAVSAPGFALTDSNHEAVAAICRVLDGLPLAIELVAARAGELSPGQMLTLLIEKARLPRPGEPGLDLSHRDPDRAQRRRPLRHQTLRAAIDWSHDLLSPQQKTLLRRLSVFAGWRLEMAEQVCADIPASPQLPAAPSLHGQAVLDLLTELADKSLIIAEMTERDTVRYRILDTIRHYAAVRLLEAGEQHVIRSRIREYFCREAERLHRVGMAQVPAPWSSRVDIFRVFDEEGSNLRQVLAWSLAGRDAETGLRICVAVGPCWIVRGSYAEGAAWMDSFLLLADAHVPGRILGPALVTRAQLALPTVLAQAGDYAREGLALSRQSRAGFWVASGLNALAEIALHAARNDEAAQMAREALEAARNAGDRWNEGYALATLAAARGQQGEVAEALRFAESALIVMREIDQRWGVARVLLGMGDLARMTGEIQAADLRYREAIGIFREVKAVPEIARCLAGLGKNELLHGDLRSADRYLTESLELSMSAGSRMSVIRAIENIAVLASARRDHRHAVQLAAAGAALRASSGLPASRGTAAAQRILGNAAGLGEDAIEELWAAGACMTASAAADLAFATMPLAGTADRPAAASGRSVRARAMRHEAATTGRAGDGLDRLSAREREVVGLLVQGRSNKDIAVALSISQATVARHLSNIRSKLGLRSRAQVAAWALRDDLRSPSAGSLSRLA